MPSMTKPKPAHLLKRRRREPDPLDTPEINAMIDGLLRTAKGPEDISGRGGILDQLSARCINRALAAEMELHLGHKIGEKPSEEQYNRRNGRTQKKVRTKSGSIRIEMPRDRDSSFEPALVPKHKRSLGRFDDTMIALYARGMSQRDICRFMEDSYGVEQRPLEATYIAVWLDAMIVKTTENNSVQNRTVYIAVGLTGEGTKDVLGLWFQDTEGAKFWLQVLSELRSRGLQDILILCADGLKGLPEAVEASFPQAVFQTCIVHVIRASCRYVPWKDRKTVCEGMRKIYTALNVQDAQAALDKLEADWGKRYPGMVKTWRSAWAAVTPFLAYPPEVRRTIYTTNPIEGLNRIIRKAIKTRGHFPSDRAAQKLIYLAINNASKTWGKKPRDWLLQRSQFEVHFGPRMPALT
ncbi:hypothetical protein Q3G72_032079 [Acer saccharum]|nr:hypothetical protein Q3G72_032079 [Acer saccharum]